MSPKDKAIELKNKYYAIHYMSEEMAKQCALIAVDIILLEFANDENCYHKLRHWLNIKMEIEKL